jgi:hypothetical protein
MSDPSHLPPVVHRYFWDIDPTTLDVASYPRYVIERILEYGDPAALRWLFGRFGREELVEVLRTTRRLSPLSANFWALYFDVDKSEVPCLTMPSPRPRGRAWRS